MSKLARIHAVAPAFPPRFIDFTTLSDVETKAQVDELIEYGTVESFVIKAKIGKVFALDFFSRGKNIRSESKATVDQYARAVQGDQFRNTGDTLKFSRSGRPGDGFHRLNGVADADKPIETFLAFGIEDDALDCVDQGNTRRPAVVLGVDKKVLAACKAAERAGSAKKTIRKMSIHEQREVVNKYAGAVDALMSADGVHFSSKYPAAFWAVLILLHRKHPTHAVRFAQEMCAPETVEMHPSVRLLRKFLLINNSDGGARLWDVTLYTAVAVRHFVAGRSPKFLRVQYGESRIDGVDGADGVSAWLKEMGV